MNFLDAFLFSHSLSFFTHCMLRLICLMFHSRRLVSDPNRVGIYVKQPAQKTVSRTVSKRIAEINQKRGESLVRKRKKDLAAKKKFSS